MIVYILREGNSQLSHVPPPTHTITHFLATLDRAWFYQLAITNQSSLVIGPFCLFTFIAERNKIISARSCEERR